MYTIWDQESYNQIVGRSKYASEMSIDPPTGKEILTSGYFYIPDDQVSIIETSNLTGMAPYIHNIWQVYVSTMHERHNEAIYHENVFADTHLTFAMGAEPIEVNIQGFVATNPVHNARLDFYTFYQLLLRGTAQKELGINVVFKLQRTEMNLYLRSLQADIVPDMPDFTQINLVGVGLKYHIAVVVPND